MSRRELKSFLIINPFGIGDVLFSTPLIRRLKDNFPSARIHYLCNRRNAALLKNHPCIDTIFEFEHADFEKEKQASFWRGIRKYASFIAGIRRARIDCSIDLSLCAQFGFFSLAAGIPKRFGLDYKGRGRFLNGKVAISGFNDKHVVEYYLDVLPLLAIKPAEGGRLEVYSDAASSAWAQDFIGKNCPPGRPVIGIAPCGGEAFGKDAHIKRWPGENFSRLINRLIREKQAQILIFAGRNEKAEIAGIMAGIEDKKSCFEFTDAPLERIIALVGHCSVFIGNDTGPLRFADALGKKLVAIFGPVDEKVYGPYPPDPARCAVVKAQVPCRPCYKKFRLPACVNNRACLTGITVEEVFSSAVRLMQ